MTTPTVLPRLALPLAVHLVAASALVVRIQPSLERELERLGTVRHGVPALVLLLAFLPATVPAVLGLLTAPLVRRSDDGLGWFGVGLWLTAGDTCLRAVVAWLLPPATGLGEVFQRVALAPDATGRLLGQLAPGAARAVGAVAESADPLPHPAGRGVIAGLACAVVLAVGVRVASTPAVAAWLSVLA
jgi:hypothetical protein